MAPYAPSKYCGHRRCQTRTRYLRHPSRGPEKVLGIFVEPQERTGRRLDDACWHMLDAFRTETGIPIISIETASASYRGQPQPFATTGHGPDIRAWWPGGQTGFIHLTDALRTKASDYGINGDGDEISLIRCHHHLRALRLGAHDHACQAFEPVLDALRSWGYGVRGSGLYYVVDVGPDADAISARLRTAGLSTRSFINGAIALVPPFDITVEDASRAIDLLKAELKPD